MTIKIINVSCHAFCDAEEEEIAATNYNSQFAFFIVNNKRDRVGQDLIKKYKINTRIDREG